MIESSFDPQKSILHVRPQDSLDKADFAQLAEKVDPYIEAHGRLRGLIIDAATFPGWDNFGAVVAHIRFVRDHHKHIEKVAVVTDSVLGDVAERLASHFVSAEIKRFSGGELEAARQWMTSGQ